MPAKPLTLRLVPSCLLMTAMLFGGCASTAPRTSADAGAGADLQSFGLGEDGAGVPVLTPQMANEVIIRALSLVGIPYRFGGASPLGGFDCSGLVQFVFQDVAGIRLPRTTREQIDMPSANVPREQLMPGDLVFFNPAGGRVSHIGIYVGEERFVHAPSRGGTVRLDRLDSKYWNRFYVGARRVIQ